jgi:hypothetical protein
MTDFLRVSDLEHLPSEALAAYMPGHPQAALAN